MAITRERLIRILKEKITEEEQAESSYDELIYAIRKADFEGEFGYLAEDFIDDLRKISVDEFRHKDVFEYYLRLFNKIK